jgi:hypothetical protein
LSIFEGGSWEKTEKSKEYEINAKPTARWGRKATGLRKAEIAGLPAKVTRLFYPAGGGKRFATGSRRVV